MSCERFSLRVLGKKVALRLDAAPEAERGIIVPDLYKPDVNTATVLAAGPDSGLEAGDRVVIARMAGQHLADATCDRLGEAHGRVYVLHAENVCMRNGAPVAGHVVVLLDAQQTRIAGTSLDIVLPEVCRDQQTTGVVLLAGDGCDCKPTDRVLFGKFNGCELGRESVLALGLDAEAQVYVMRETHEVEVLGPGGKKHRLPADEVYGVQEA